MYYTMLLVGRQDFGRRKNDPAKDRKALATYGELKGYKHGEIEIQVFNLDT